MLGKLSQVAQTNITNGDTVVNITGISENCTYLLIIKDVMTTGTPQIRYRLTASGSPVTSSTYEYAYRTMIDGAYQDHHARANAFTDSTATLYLQDYNGFHAEIYLNNFYDSNEKSTFIEKNVFIQATPMIHNFWGVGCETTNATRDGFSMHLSTGDTFTRGQLTLFKLVQ
jgi:hypothetical protein